MGGGRRGGLRESADEREGEGERKWRLNRSIDEADCAKKRVASEAFCDWARTGVTDRKKER